MNRVQFFYDQDLEALERKINTWLEANNEKKIVTTCLNSFAFPAGPTQATGHEKYVFYVLYTMPEWENILLEKNAEEHLPGAT